MSSSTNRNKVPMTESIVLEEYQINEFINTVVKTVRD